MLPLRVVINAQLLSGGHSGGIEQFLVGLVSALGRLTDGPEEYVIVTDPEDPDWLNSFLGPNARVFTRKRSRLKRAQARLGPLRGVAGRVWRQVRRLTAPRLASDAPTIPASDSSYESLHGALIHFPFQSFTRCKIPAIFNPHDLQHLHFPQFFSPQDVAARDAGYRAACLSAHAVVAESHVAKDDLTRHYCLSEEQVYVIHRGSPTVFYETVVEQHLHEVTRRFNLPESFALFSAQTWPHKNHVRLVEALNLLRARHGMRLNLVCTGHRNSYWPSIQARIDELRLSDQVSFLGYIKASDLRALYRLAQFVVFPSLFEGGGFPVVEAFQEGVAVTCSAIPALQEYGGDAILPFDPSSVESIGEALRLMSGDVRLRTNLRIRGAARVRQFTWERTGRMYRALYRKVAGRPLSEDDQVLLADSSARVNGRSLCTP